MNFEINSHQHLAKVVISLAYAVPVDIVYIPLP